MTLEQRVDTLERTARRWRACALVLAGLAMALAGVAAAPSRAPDVIEARELRVVDDDGEVLFMAGKLRTGEPALILRDVRGDVAFSVQASPERLLMLNKRGRELGIAMEAGPQLSKIMVSGSMTRGTALSATKEGTSLMFTHGNGEPGTVVGVYGTTGFIRFQDDQRKPLLVLPPGGNN